MDVEKKVYIRRKEKEGKTSQKRKWKKAKIREELKIKLKKFVLIFRKYQEL